MKALLVSLITCFLITTTQAQESSIKQAPFSTGVNLTNWFQAESPASINFTKYTKQDFENIKSLGADVIRLPINLHSMVGASPEYPLDSLFLFFLDQVVDWAEEVDIHLILDNHTFSPTDDTDPNIGRILVPVWTQLAEHYTDRSELIHYEVLNEPHGISNEDWNAIQLSVVNAIRTVDEKHSIIVGGSDFNSYNSLSAMPQYADTNLIYTFHFYDPFILTHQGASWVGIPMDDLGGIPFPYEASSMPSLPSSLVGTWAQSSFNNYSNEGNATWVKQQLDIALSFAEERGVPVFCGELGVYDLTSDNQSRVNWHEVVNGYLNEHGISWTNWDYHGGFGIFEKNTAGLFNHHINVPLVEAMGFDVPPQTEFIAVPDTNIVEIYSDYSGSGITTSGNGTLNFYIKDDESEGEFVINWTGANQYQNINFDFRPDRDFSLLAKNDFTFSMRIKGDSQDKSFDLRFLDTKVDLYDHPWRMNFHVDSTVVPFDGEWHLLEIPLSSFIDMGSWDNEQWYDPQGLFDWTAVDQFAIVAENGNIGSANFWFDEIKIKGEPFSSTEETQIASTIYLKQNYPNPFNPNTRIEYTLQEGSLVELTILDVLGRRIKTLTSAYQSSGNYTVDFNATGLSSGIYFYRLSTEREIITKKMILMK